MSVWTILVRGRTNRWTLQSLQPNNNALVISAVIWRWTMKINKITSTQIFIFFSISQFFFLHLFTIFIKRINTTNGHGVLKLSFLKSMKSKQNYVLHCSPHWAEPWTLKKSNEQPLVNGWQTPDCTHTHSFKCMTKKEGQMLSLSSPAQTSG